MVERLSPPGESDATPQDARTGVRKGALTSYIPRGGVDTIRDVLIWCSFRDEMKTRSKQASPSQVTPSPPRRCPSTLPHDVAHRRCPSTSPLDVAPRRCPSTLPTRRCCPPTLSLDPASMIHHVLVVHLVDVVHPRPRSTMSTSLDLSVLSSLTLVSSTATLSIVPTAVEREVRERWSRGFLLREKVMPHPKTRARAFAKGL